MEKELNKLEKAVDVGGFGVGDVSEVVRIAQSIASFSLATYRGKLLGRALDISKAIVEYEIEMTCPNSEVE